MKEYYRVSEAARLTGVELLSPARDFASLNAAIGNGADSVYLGIPGYNLRAHTNQFLLEATVNF